MQRDRELDDAEVRAEMPAGAGDVLDQEFPDLRREFDAVLRIDTPGEADYYRNGGILQYVLRSLV